MGLDCYVRVTQVKPVTDEIWYGRKENEIHCWMQRQSGIPADQFNCVDLVLTNELLNQLEADMAADNLPETDGYFFGGGNDKEQVIEAAKHLIYVSRDAINHGLVPSYSSWW